MFAVNRTVWLGCAVLLCLVGGGGGWAAMARIDGAVVAPASLKVPQNRQVVQHPDGGIVAAVAVSDGQMVAQGDLLVQLDGAELRSQLVIAQGQMFELDARRARLRAERDGAAQVEFPADLPLARPDVARLAEGQRALFAARASTLAAQLDQLSRREDQVHSQIAGIEAQMSANDAQLALASEELDEQQRLLAQGLSQRAKLRAVEREQARLRGQGGALVADLAEARGRIDEYRMQALALTSQRREDAISELRDLTYQWAEVAERCRALDLKIGRLDIRAPSAGRVLGLSVTGLGAVVKPADPVLWIIPQTDPLVAEARIPPLNIDEVRPGQTVRLTLPAFSGRMMPEVEGRVEQVSADTLQDKEGATFYTARIALDAPQGLMLMPGMPAEAFIRTGSRSPLSYLLHPFASYFDRAFRES